MAVTRADKQRSLLDGALRAFSRDGYARASIDTIAAEAGVSSRTIYNRHGDKAALFRAVVLDSATRTAEYEIDLADRLLGRVLDLEADLVAFGLRWSARDPETAPHFALVRQIEADRAHIPDQLVTEWQEAGPRRVRSAIGTHLRRLSDDGLLAVDDPGLAALHLVQLTANCVDGTTPPDRVESVVRAGVRVFLAAYAPAR